MTSSNKNVINFSSSSVTIKKVSLKTRQIVEISCLYHVCQDKQVVR